MSLEGSKEESFASKTSKYKHADDHICQVQRKQPLGYGDEH